MQQALTSFTERYCAAWRQYDGGAPRSQHLYGIASPCILANQQQEVLWQPQPFPGTARLAAVERAMDILIRDEGHEFYTTQLAGDMGARFDSLSMILLQTWSEEDFVRMQQNLIGHLVTQRRLKLSPTLFLATLEQEDLQVVSLCNLTGNVLLETLGSRQRHVLSPSLSQFLCELEPVI